MLSETVFNNKWIVKKPHPKQAVFLALPCREALYGGSAGGGKTLALLSAALQFADVSGYNALLLRRTYRELAMPGGIMDEAHAWLRGTDAHWNGIDHRYEFPSGATLTFGYLESDADKYRYQGPAFQMIGTDELTQHREESYRYMFSRIRRETGVNVPLRMRAASNPGGIGHEWVKQRFITGSSAERVFVPARLEDNPSLDQDAYLQSLNELDPITRAQLLEGNWEISGGGKVFDRSWFRIVDSAPADLLSTCRGWDFAATQDGGDYTAGVKISKGKDGIYYIHDVIRGQWSPGNVDRVFKTASDADGRKVRIRFEQEGGASGKKVAFDYVRLMAGYDVKPIPATGSKLSRWRPLAAQAEAGNVVLVRGAWNGAFLDELHSLTADDEHANDDAADGAAIAFNELTSGVTGGLRQVSGF
jgi:predicted phage terminase large subunit-like protein